MLEATEYLVKNIYAASELLQNEHIEVQENWLDNPDVRANDGKNSSVIHTQALIMLTSIQLYLKLRYV